jgi:hypothetical protein
MIPCKIGMSVGKYATFFAWICWYIKVRNFNNIKYIFSLYLECSDGLDGAKLGC